jgi:hypothetical protein
VTELDADFLVLRVRKFDDLAERLFLAVEPKAGVFGRDAALWGYTEGRVSDGRYRSEISMGRQRTYEVASTIAKPGPR